MKTPNIPLKFTSKVNNIAMLNALLILAILIIDLKLPLGIAGGVPYVIVILVSLWFRNNKYVISFAIICSILTIVGLFFSPKSAELWQVLVNRSLALFVIWITVILALKHQATQQQLIKIEYEAELTRQKKEIYLATMQSALHVTNNLLNQLKIVELEIANHQEFDQEVTAMFTEMQSEAKALINKLSLVKEVEPKNILQSVQP